MKILWIAFAIFLFLPLVGMAIAAALAPVLALLSLIAHQVGTAWWEWRK